MEFGTEVAFEITDEKTNKPNGSGEKTKQML